MIKKRFIILLIVVFIIAGSAASYAYISTPIGCTTCHEMTSFYEEWVSSDHQEIDCHVCHQQGLDSYVSDLISHLQGVDPSEIEQEPPGSPPNGLCMTCHETLPISSEKSSDITCQSCHEIDHYEHVKEMPGDYDCSTCHTDHTMVVEEATCKSVGCHGS